ncbi:restriction endonuclease PLD domain-containing protein [Bacillus benzoevorans]|uniref:NgoFVII family restriction endonuclease n=1 Tax=Bacillus benzoevorans TaxID=1456 RepID=A0A7X0HY92_9BACI|nr:restriction endonuclease PLD domain-containing protein [Bacillus benzoevorans]MBB6447801.1 hypothetical protein [Bacillus benzoevorans]
MLFSNNLDQLIFNTHKYIHCDNLVIISGYASPRPIQQLSNLPIKSTVIYGMFGSESIPFPLHKTLVNLHNSTQTRILYSNLPIHSNCYIWRYKSDITYVLIGSANLTTRGLTIPLRETLAETSVDTFEELNNYLNLILDNSVPCNTVDITPNGLHPFVDAVCSLELYNPRSNKVPDSSGLNWGNSVGHTNPGDAYITIRTSHVRNFPRLFPPKQDSSRNKSSGRGRANRQNDSIELIWDDGTLMDVLLEGSQTVNGLHYPKQLSSFPNKNTLGVYIRERLGLPPTALVTKTDLDLYGRDNIHISLLQSGIYYADFSVQ